MYPFGSIRNTNKSSGVDVVTFTDIVEILDEAKQDFYCIVIGDSFENPSQEEIEERERWYKMEIEPKIKKWFGDKEMEK